MQSSSLLCRDDLAKGCPLLKRKNTLEKERERERERERNKDKTLMNGPDKLLVLWLTLKHNFLLRQLAKGLHELFLPRPVVSRRWREQHGGTVVGVGVVRRLQPARCQGRRDSRRGRGEAGLEATAAGGADGSDAGGQAGGGERLWRGRDVQGAS